VVGPGRLVQHGPDAFAALERLRLRSVNFFVCSGFICAIYGTFPGRIAWNGSYLTTQKLAGRLFSGLSRNALVPGSGADDPRRCALETGN